MRKAQELSKRRNSRGQGDSSLSGQFATDALEPVPEVSDWEQRWLTGLDDQPKRITVPGQTAAEVKAAERAFGEFLRRLQVTGETSFVQADCSLQASSNKFG